jgi:Lar family restriction alleviation protein
MGLFPADNRNKADTLEENKMKKEALKPCPFCGGEAELIALDLQWHIHCYGCDVYVHFASDSLRDEAIAAWNKRTEEK